MLVIENLTASYAALSAISDISFTLAKGARLGIFGHNGAGKTTLLKCIVGAHAPNRGQVVYDDVPIAAGNIAATVLRGIAFVPQGHNVFPNLSVEQNLKIAGLLFDASFVTQVYELFPVLKARGPRARGAKGLVAMVLSAHLHSRTLASTSRRWSAARRKCASFNWPPSVSAPRVPSRAWDRAGRQPRHVRRDLAGLGQPDLFAMTQDMLHGT